MLRRSSLIDRTEHFPVGKETGQEDLITLMRFLTRNQSGYTLLELLYVMSIIALLTAMVLPQILIQKSKIIEVSAQRRLRSIGSVMADYNLSHEGGNFADFQQLKDAQLISHDLTQTSLIKDYSLQFLIKKAAPIGAPSAFTVIAYPILERTNGSLSTFAITEDNVIRVYKPGGGRNPNDPQTWGPIL
jgi:prepilin-type N-terminal cleavage/methylation domain-containing protein